MNKKIKLLVCICTQNRKKKLGRLLKSLNNLLKINDIYLNIIVVENELKSRLNKSVIPCFTSCSFSEYTK